MGEQTSIKSDISTSLKIRTLPTTDTPDSDPSIYLGETFHIVIVVTALILALIAIALNLSIMVFHGGKLKNSIVSFIYFILSLSDFCTGICALLHALIFITMLVMEGNLSSNLYWLIGPAYFLTNVAFKTSAFVSMVFAVIRTINIVFPFKHIRKNAVLTAIGLYTFFWVIIFSIEIGFILHIQFGKGINNADPRVTDIRQLLFGSYFYTPNRVTWPDYFTSTNSKCVLEMSYTVVPFTLCAIITVIGTVIQLKSLALSPSPLMDESDAAKELKRNEMRRISYTIIIISTFFVLCTSCSLYYPVYEVCIAPSELKNRKTIYALGYLPFFVNAAGNPLILFTRVKSYRNFLASKSEQVNPTASRRVRNSIASILNKMSTSSSLVTG